MKIKTTGAKSLTGLKEKNRKRRSTRVKGSEEEVQNLLEMQREAVQQKMSEAGGGVIKKGIGGLKGLQEAYKLQEEYKEAKSGVQSRYGKFAKAFGLADEKQAAMLDKFFGKEVPKEELEKMREKFKIKDPKADEGKSKATKGLKKQSEKSKLRDEQITKIYELSEKIHEIVGGIKSSVDGIANKLRASPAKAAPKSKKEMRKLEKQAGLKYSKEASRYRDEKTGKFVSKESARQRMNISPTASPSNVQAKAATPAAGASGAAMAPTATPAVDADLKSQTLKEAAPEEQKDETGDKLDKLSKDVKKVDENINDILDIFSLKSFYKLIGGAIGFAFPFLKKAVEFIWDIGSKGVKWIVDLSKTVWENLRDFLTTIRLDIPEIMGPVEIDLPGLDPFTLGPIGGFTFEPFKFLKKPIESPDKVTPPAENSQEEKKSSATASGGGGGGAPSAAPSAPPAAASAPPAAGGGGGGARAALQLMPGDTLEITAAAGGGAAGAGSGSGGSGGSGGGGGGAPTATPSGSNMPGGSAPAAGGGGGGAGGGAGGAVIGVVKGAMAEYGITNPYAQAALLANIEKESGFKPKSENLNYTSIERIRTVFTRLKKYSDEELQAKAVKNPEGMAELVYGMNDKIGRSMGNTEPGDGWKYRGRGFIQITGKNNYAKYGKMIGVDLISNPDQANDPAVAAKLAAAFVMAGLKGKQDFSDQKTANRAVTQTIGGAGLGLDKGYGAEILAKVDKYSTKYTPTGVPAGGTGQAPGGPMYAAGGGVASGPQSGYPATLHGTEAIVPLDGQSYQSKQAVTAVSKAVSGEELGQQSAENSMASTGPSVVPVPVPGGGGGDKQAAPPQKSDNSVKADVRFADDTFNRAISKDFAHPTSFTSVGFA